MKNLFVLALILGSFSLQAQQDVFRQEIRKERKAALENFSAEERATLKTKKMTLHLDLNEKQQQQVKALILKNEQNLEVNRPSKEALKNLTNNEKFALKNARLDQQIEMKNALREILTPEQFEKFEHKLRGTRKPRGENKRG